LDCASPLALWPGPSNVYPRPHKAPCLFRNALTRRLAYRIAVGKFARQLRQHGPPPTAFGFGHAQPEGGPSRRLAEDAAAGSPVGAAAGGFPGATLRPRRCPALRWASRPSPGAGAVPRLEQARHHDVAQALPLPTNPARRARGSVRPSTRGFRRPDRREPGWRRPQRGVSSL